MHSENRPFQPEASQPETELVPQLKRTLYPDSLKFLSMAKELLDSPAIKQAIEDEKLKPEDGS